MCVESVDRLECGKTNANLSWTDTLAYLNLIVHEQYATTDAATVS